MNPLVSDRICGRLSEDSLCFRFKPRSLHVCGKAVVADLSAWPEIRPVHANMCFDWSGTFACREVMEFDEDAVMTDLCAFAERAQYVGPGGASQRAMARRTGALVVLPKIEIKPVERCLVMSSCSADL